MNTHNLFYYPIFILLRLPVYLIILHLFWVIPTNGLNVRTKIIVGNWKSYLNHEPAISLTQKIKQNHQIYSHFYPNKKIILLPPSLYLSEIQNHLKDTTLHVGAQHCSTKDNGAYTGEITATMLNSADISYCLVGHYERKQHFSEKEDDVFIRVLQLLQQNITPIYCFGETADEFQNDETIYSCLSQLRRLVSFLYSQLPPSEHIKISRILFAYEPIWAIGTGIVPGQVFTERVYSSIHSFLSYRYQFNPIILYGGSVHPNNIHTMGIYNGLLVGQTSIHSKLFNEICVKF